MRFSVVISACLLLLASQPALAAWAVAQSGNGQPYLQRFRTPEMARDAVLDACGQRQQSCRVVLEGGSGCAAIATTGTQWRVAKAGTQQRASASALGACESLGVGACRIEHEFCGQ